MISPPFFLHPAQRSDGPAIRKLIYHVGINPSGLDWRRFIVASTTDRSGSSRDELLGCGQVKPHQDGTRELASIAVWPAYQHQGIARAIIERLLHENQPPLFLICRAPLHLFYEKFGFQVIPPVEMRPYFRQVWRFVQVVGFFTRSSPWLSIMRWD